MRAFLTLAAGALLIGFWVYTVVDCSLTDARRARGIPKPAWILVVIVFNIIGGALWLIIGKDRSAGSSERIRVAAPEDDPTFIRKLGKEVDQDERIRELEREIAELDEDSPDK